MAKITRDEILKLAKLAQLKLSDQEIEKYQTELQSIMEYADILTDVDVIGTKPTYQVTGLQNVTRPDVAMDYGVSRDELLKNVPHREADYIKVKRMIE